MPGRDRGPPGFDDRGSRMEIRFAKLEMDDRPALTLQLLRPGKDRESALAGHSPNS